MIQRVQTLFLLGVAILMILLTCLPIWKKVNDKPQVGSTPNSVTLSAFNLSYDAIDTFKNPPVIINKSKESTWYIGTLSIVCGILALASIFQFKNRLLQLRLGVLNTILISGVIGTIFLGINIGDNFIPGDKQEFLIGFFIPLIALLLNFMANRFIKKDEALVRSVDRIR